MDAHCYCGSKAVLLTAWTDINPGRRFWKCGNRMHPCGFFEWFDPPMCRRAVEIIPGFIRRIRENEAVRGNGTQNSTWKILWVCLVIVWLVTVWVIFGENEDEEIIGKARKFPAISDQ